MFLLAEQDSVEEVNSSSDVDTKIEVYDRVIKDCVDALQSLKEDLKSDEVQACTGGLSAPLLSLSNL